MIYGLIGKKIGMTQVFRDNGLAEAATVILAGPCTVLQLKTVAKEGYSAAQLGFGEAKKQESAEQESAKPESAEQGSAKPESAEQGSAEQESPKGPGNFRYLREFKLAETGDIKVGDKVDVGLFKAGDLVDITGVSKGRGFAGVVKRYGFAGGPKTHGQSDRHRAPGSIGAGSSPGRVLKGKRMPGHMGGSRVTVRRLEVLEADPARNLLVVKGAAPGAKNGTLLIRKSSGGK
jgi:large subunit ribosomal protein L3